MNAGRWIARKRHVVAWLLLLALWSGIAQAIEQDSIADNPGWKEGMWRGAYTEGLEAARKQDWVTARTLFIQAFNEQRESRPLDGKDHDAPQLWYNLALTLTHFPGHELRAAALFSAYLVKYPHSPQRAAIVKEIDRLLAGLDERIDLLRTEQARQYRNIGMKPEDPADESKLGGAVIAKRLADQGDLAAAESHAARFESWLAENQAKRGDGKSYSSDQLEILRARIALYESLIDAYIQRYNRNMAKGRDLAHDVYKARGLYDKSVRIYRESVEEYRLNWSAFSGAPARFNACDARRNGYGFSMELMKENISRFAVADRYRDTEMVRFGIVEHWLGEYATAEKTFRSIKDDTLRNKWLTATRNKVRLTAPQILDGFRHSASPILSGFRHADWDHRRVDTDKIPIVTFRKEAAGIETEENQTLACLGVDVEKERLLNLASMGIDLLACSVLLDEKKLVPYPMVPYLASGKKWPGNVPAGDLNVAQCLNDISQPEFEPMYGAREYPEAIGTIADSLSRGAGLIRRYGELYDAFPEAP